ncbi:tetratricopeptide repeat protein [Mucilaginibacter sp.]|uniref:tetratricopeptide repeat protein n=1 Tax=Mucilaginibacter sp. TaxID=1882438 RepID=UPI0026343F49|nr:tetratricopeptide repeat protein [Mucilaginibacter sp.]MDB4927084.1 Tetratricopeptide repeat protein [Mucilaginibacter sp.]
MKTLLSATFLLLVLLTNLFAQSRRADDALLLDYYQGQHFADALTYLKGVYPEPVNDARELSRLAYTSNMAGMLPDAESYYQRIYDKDSTNQSVLYNIAVINQRRGNNTKAEFYYRKLIVLDSNNFSVNKRLAQIYHDKLDIKNEVYYLQRSNIINPTDADLASDLSDAYIVQKQFPKAEKVLKVAIAADPENIILQQSLLKLSYAEKNWRETVRTGEQLLLVGDSSASTTSKLGRAYYETKNYQCGITALLSIQESYQTENSVYYTAACYKQLKDQKNAIFYFNKAIFLSISPSTGTYYNEIADSYETLKQFKKAQGSYEKGLLYDDKPITYYFLAIMYDTELKDKKGALKYYKKFLAAKPDKTQQSYIDYSTARIGILSMK